MAEVLTGADIGVVAAYFVAIIAVGLFASCRSNRGSVSGYFLAGRSMWFFPIGASLFVSNIGTEHFIGLAGSGAAQGISVGAWEFNAILLLQLLGWIFIPVYIACGTYTMPEYLSKRFGGSRLRVYFAFLSLVLYIFTKCSGDLYTGALFIQQSLKWDLYVSIIILVLITAVLTMTGGLTAVIYTDTLQAILMVGGALYLMGVGFTKVGGFQGIVEKYPQAVPTNISYIVPNTTCHHPDKQAFRMLRSVDDDYMPWLGFLLGQTPGSIWYWCTDQVIVQRLLAAKNLAHAQGATLMAGFIKILPLFMMVMPGMMSRILYPSFTKVGGFQGIVEKYPQAVPTNISYIVPNTTCHHPDKQAFRMLRSVDDDYMPWLGFLLGQTPGSIWYWCTDQVIVQRLLAAKNLAHAQGATLMAGFIKILPLFMMVMPGMMSRILYPNEVGCTNPDMCYEICQSRAGCTSIAYPKLVLGLMPAGARGLMMAVMIAALMSDLDSIFNSASTLFTIDIWKRFRKAASVTELMIVGRIFIVVMVGISIAWVPVIKETQGGQVFIYIQEVTNYLAPPFAAVFLLAILVPRVNEKGAFWSLMFAFLVGVVRLFIAFMFQGEGVCGAKETYPLPPIIKNFHYMYFAMFITGTTAILALVISYCTEPPHPKQVHRTTYWTRNDTEYLETELEMKNKVANGVDNPAVEMKDVEITDTEKKVYKEPIEKTPTESLKKASTGRLVLNFLLGIKTEQEEEKDTGQEDHMQAIADLKQTKFQKVILTSGLVLILAIGVTMYIFWSLYDFNPPSFYPEGANNETLLLGDKIPLAQS